VGGGTPLVVTVTDEVVAGDVCGAGDRFAVAAALALGHGASLAQAVDRAVQDAAAFVASGGARGVQGVVAVPPAPPEVLPAADLPGERALPSSVPDAVAALIGRVRARNGTVVAAGGCFDLLHAGHVELLQRARSLGDCLVVLLNSDSSVRALKGDGRPIIGAADRTTILEALAAVDAVVSFDDDTPIALLEALRPDLYVKGGDYATSVLPEQTVLDRWGGVAIAIPYLDGRSTTHYEELIHGT
jgi:rfaE bifunctional protein nucleotidyltransferase chain/domain